MELPVAMTAPSLCHRTDIYHEFKRTQGTLAPLSGAAWCPFDGKMAAFAGTKDMSKAYRQIPAASEHLKHSVVCVWGPVEGRWVFAILHGLAFGLVLAVLTFNRYPSFISALAQRWIAIPCTNFHDDFKLHTTVHDGGSTSHYFDRLMAKSCLEWTGKVRDQLQQIFEGAPFSISEAASEHGRLQSFNAILEGRASRSQTVAFS